MSSRFYGPLILAFLPCELFRYVCRNLAQACNPSAIFRYADHSICDSSRDLGACMDGTQDAILSHSFLGH